ncbi:hypothetical protein GS4_39_00690 [Gordonia soli NBRC 108243]|uniref:Uncharacterized protein n=1 Tax=Gordonia soli NBRC 108243 TaxID=1223545 RepID=M0QQ81_9ACTN|nr:hypothetical protein GS4_39_00690 [Gordonia soli NBRC 108243]
MLGEVGERLREALEDENDDVPTQLLITEACRMADRLHRLDLILSGDEDTWMRLDLGKDSVIEVRVTSPLQESRQLSTVFRQLLAEIRRAKAEQAAGAGETQGDVLAGL